MPARLDTRRCPTPWWLPDGHSQTIAAAKLARRLPVSYVRERVETPDGDFFDIDWTVPGLRPGIGLTQALSSGLQRGNHQPALVLLHGLEGSSGSHYALAIAQHFRARGWAVAIPHFRGCSGLANRLPRAYHSGDIDSVQQMLQTVQSRLPDARWHAVGISLGGNALALWLGSQPGQTRWLQSAAVVSAPLDLTASGPRLGRGLINRNVYTRMFLRTLRNKVLDKARLFPGVIDVLRVAEARDLYAFDDAYTAPIHGYAGVQDYWRRASALPVLSSIRTPTLILNARNDPFLPQDALPSPGQAADCVLLHQPATGGHAGFPTSQRGLCLDWLPRRLEHYFAQGD